MLLLLFCLQPGFLAAQRAEAIRKDVLNPCLDKVLVVAHRGNWSIAPENSLAAIDSAIRMKVDIVEIDIRKTKDGQLVLMHDDTVDRTTNGTGKVKDKLSFNADVSLGYWFNSISGVRLSFGTNTFRPAVWYDADKMTQETLDEIRRLSHMDKMVAIGEIGLDYYWHKEEEEHQIQKKMFRAQLDIAREEKLPFMIHSREAAEDTLNIVREYMQGGMYGGIIHCFSYSREIAAEYLKMGLYLGIGGVVTFKNAKKLKETVQYAPLSQLVLETDCPYMSPEPNRGKRNSSLNLPYVAQAIAELKRITAEEVIDVTRQNAEKLLGIHQ